MYQPIKKCTHGNRKPKKTYKNKITKLAYITNIQPSNLDATKSTAVFNKTS